MNETERVSIPLDDKITHWKQCMDRDYIGHWDIPEGGKFELVIESVMQDEVMNPTSYKKEFKTVMRFKKAKKGLIMNNTNMKAVESHYGSNPKLWQGNAVTLTRAKTKLGRDTVECVRIVPRAGYNPKKSSLNETLRAAQPAAETTEQATTQETP